MTDLITLNITYKNPYMNNCVYEEKSLSDAFLKYNNKWYKPLYDTFDNELDGTSVKSNKIIGNIISIENNKAQLTIDNLRLKSIINEYDIAFKADIVPINRDYNFYKVNDILYFCLINKNIKI